MRDVIPAIEAAGLEPARAVLTSSRDTHVCRFRHVPVVYRFIPSGSPGNLSQGSPRGCLLFILLFACHLSGDSISGRFIKQCGICGVERH